MGILMADILGCHQIALFLQQFGDRFIGLKDIHPTEMFNVFGKFSLIIDRGIDIKPITQAGFIIFLTVPRSCMDTSGP